MHTRRSDQPSPPLSDAEQSGAERAHAVSLKAPSEASPPQQLQAGSVGIAAPPPPLSHNAGTLTLTRRFTGV